MMRRWSGRGMPSSGTVRPHRRVVFSVMTVTLATLWFRSYPGVSRPGRSSPPRAHSGPRCPVSCVQTLSEGAQRKSRRPHQPIGALRLNPVDGARKSDSSDHADAVPTEVRDLDPLVFGQTEGTDLADDEAVEWGDGRDRSAVPLENIAAGPTPRRQVGLQPVERRCVRPIGGHTARGIVGVWQTVGAAPRPIDISSRRHSLQMCRCVSHTMECDHLGASCSLFDRTQQRSSGMLPESSLTRLISGAAENVPTIHPFRSAIPNSATHSRRFRPSS